MKYLKITRAFATLISATLALSALAGTADTILKEADFNGGLIVVVGCENPDLITDLCAKGSYLTHAIDADSAKVEKAIRHIRAKGLYGQASASVFSGKRLPYADNLVNLLVCSQVADFRLQASEIERVLAPGGVAIVDGKKTVKPRPAEIDSWTHYLYGPENNAVSKDTVVSQPRSIQWVADPMWARSHEQMASVSALVSERGRVMYIEDLAPRVSIRYLADWKLTCRDAFNGTLLWQRDIGLWSDHLRHFRTGPLHLPRRLVAVDGKVYVTLAIDAPVSVLDGVTGRTIRDIKGTERTDEIVVDNGIAYLVIGTSEINRRGSNDSFYARGEPEATTYRLVRAIDLSSDKVLWEKDFSRANYILPLSLTIHGDSVYYQTLKGVGRLDAGTGKEMWLTPRDTVSLRMAFSAPTVVATDEVLLVADRTPKKPVAQPEKKPATGKKSGKKQGGLAVPATDDVEWGIHGWNVSGIPRSNPSELIAYSTEDGSRLWSKGVKEIYNSPVDVFVIDDVVYTSTGWSGVDLKTGASRVHMKGGRGVAMAHHRCYRNKASVNYIFTGRDGIEVLDAKKGWIGNNSWIRGTCQLGIMPANGLLYTPQNACGCHNQVQLQGFFAAAPRRNPQGEMIADESRLVKGPAFGDASASAAEAGLDWPMYRANGKRGGAVTTKIPDKLSKAWSTKITGLESSLTRSQLTQPISVGNAVYIAVKDEHTIYALDVETGKQTWSYTTGGRIDSAPTYHNGMIISGSADGNVYCIRARDGELAWKFMAAPRDMLVFAYGQLESAWPVHGSVLVHNGELVFTAGRSTYLDDGFVFHRLNPETGALLAKKQITLIDPQTDKQTGKDAYRGRAAGFHMEGTMTDIMCSTGDTVHMKYMQLDKDGNEIPETAEHLYSATSMLAEEWFIRTYWFYGSSYGGGWGGWSHSAKYPSGRLLIIDDGAIFGYGRSTIAGGGTGHKADSYHLYKNKGWSDKNSLVVRAMAKAGDKVVVAGPVDLSKRSSKMLAYDNEDEALASYKGERGVMMRVVSAEEGTVLSETEIDAIPAFDGISAANGKVFVALKNGELQCWK